MNPMDFLEPEELLRFFHCRKTEMSCMEKPQTFLRQLRDYNLIPEDRYKRVSRMKSKENMKAGVYDILDRLEREQSQHINVFWTCVFKETILHEYPTLKQLRDSLLDGSYHCDLRLAERVEEEEEQDGRGRLALSEDKEKKAKFEIKKRKRRNVSTSNDEQEQPGPSSHLSPGQRKKSKKIHFSSPLKKGEKRDIWTWPIYKSQLPVTCGQMKGTLIREKMETGDRCILAEKQWFTPNEFEKFAGKGSSKNWKTSIRCGGTTLGKLIKEGQLKSAIYRRRKAVRKTPPSSNDSIAESDSEEEHEVQVLSNGEENRTDETEGEEGGETEEEQPEARFDPEQMVFDVTCGALSGTLYKKRFVSGRIGKSIRTEARWMSPIEFVKAASGQTDGPWRKDIEYDGKPISDLIKADVLKIHSLLCTCGLCSGQSEDLENERNDDECCICKSAGEEELVVCDECPRSFHPKCHLPHVEDETLRPDQAWACTFCIFEQYKQYRSGDERNMEEAMCRPVSLHLLECQYLLLFLFNADNEQIFATNPELHIDNYSSYVKTPMWLGKVTDRLQGKEYSSVDQFISDIQLIFTNCASYNKNNPEFLAMGKRLKQLFDGEVKMALNISESSDTSC
ncbi:uncharacterized protein ACNS7B_010196 isoform 1-T1 [Menidia menidia]